MTSEEEIIIAFLFKREGKTEVTASDFCLSLSMDLNWFSPTQAKAFVERAITNKLLVKHDDMLSPTFNVELLAVPVGFHPSTPSTKNMRGERKDPKQKSKHILQSIVERIAKESSIEEEVILERIQKLREEKNISPEVAALLLGKELGGSLTDFFEVVNNGIIKQNKG